MRRLRLPEIALGIGLGIVISLFGAGVSSYQTEHCEQTAKNQAAEPSPQDPIPSAHQGDNGNQQIAEYPNHPPFFGCSAIGLVKSAIGFMDSHEGFFVGIFTFILAAFTWMLRQTTVDLADAGERQIGIANQMADLAGQQVAITATQTDIQKRQHAVGRLEFFATHRPEITVHAIEFKRITSQDQYDWIGASILAINKGPTPAMNVEVRGQIMPTVSPGIDIQRPLVKAFVKVASGEKLRVNIESNWQVR